MGRRCRRRIRILQGSSNRLFVFKCRAEPFRAALVFNGMLAILGYRADALPFEARRNGKGRYGIVVLYSMFVDRAENGWGRELADDFLDAGLAFFIQL
jgi:hypothetical protein